MFTRFKIPRETPTFLLILLLAILMAIFVPAFRELSNLRAVGQSAAFIGIVACGEGLVILGGGLDLSVGSILALASCATAACLEAGMAWPVSFSLGLLSGGIAGIFNGALITDRLPIPFLGVLFEKLRSRNILRIPKIPRPPILTTLATLLIFRNGISILTKSHSYGPFKNDFYQIGQGWTPLITFILLTVVFMLVTLKTSFGRWVLALGGSEQSARLSGIPVDIVKQGTYFLSGVCAALGGILLIAFNNNAQAKVGEGFELDAIAACVVGGVRIKGGDGTILGVALGAVLIVLLQNVFVLTGRPKEQQGLLTGAIILTAALLEQWRIHRLESKGKAV